MFAHNLYPLNGIDKIWKYIVLNIYYIFVFNLYLSKENEKWPKLNSRSQLSLAKLLIDHELRFYDVREISGFSVSLSVVDRQPNLILKLKILFFFSLNQKLLT